MECTASLLPNMLACLRSSLAVRQKNHSLEQLLLLASVLLKVIYRGYGHMHTSSFRTLSTRSANLLLVGKLNIAFKNWPSHQKKICLNTEC